MHIVTEWIIKAALLFVGFLLLKRTYYELSARRITRRRIDPTPDSPDPHLNGVWITAKGVTKGVWESVPKDTKSKVGTALILLLLYSLFVWVIFFPLRKWIAQWLLVGPVFQLMVMAIIAVPVIEGLWTLLENLLPAKTSQVSKGLSTMRRGILTLLILIALTNPSTWYRDLDSQKHTSARVEMASVANSIADTWKSFFHDDQDDDGYDDDEIVAMPRGDFSFSRTTPKYGLNTGLRLTRDKDCQYRTYLQREWRTLRRGDNPNVTGHRWVQFRPLSEGDMVRVDVLNKSILAHIQ